MINPIDQFNINQKEQIDLAKNYFHLENSAIYNHPEYDALFMNCIINRESNGNPVFIEDIVKFLKPIKETDVKSDKIGSDFEVLSLLYKILDSNYTLPVFTGEYNSKQLLYELLTYLLSCKNAEKTNAGRYKVNKIDNIEVLMSEGSTKAYEIIDTLENIAARKERYSSDSDIEYMLLDRMFNMRNILLGLDDMNIRGIQIEDALKYTNGSMPELAKILMAPQRSEELIEFVNNEAAKRIQAGISSEEQIAVLSGASFTNNFLLDRQEYHMSVINYEKYLSDIEPIKLNYEQMDLERGTDIDTGIKICEAHGFEKVLDIKIDKQSKYSEYSIDRILFFYNRKSQDYLVSVCSGQNFSCGETYIYAYRKKNTKEMFLANGDSHFNENAKLFYRRLNNSDGNIFKLYQFIYSENQDNIDRYQIGWDSEEYVPDLIEYYQCRGNMDEIYNISNIRNDMFFYDITKTISLFLFMPYARQSKSEELHGQYCKWVCDKAISQLDVFRPQEQAWVMKIVKEYVKIPDVIFDNYLHRIQDSRSSLKDRFAPNCYKTFKDTYNGITNADVQKMMKALQLPELSKEEINNMWEPELIRLELESKEQDEKEHDV